jgi:Tfp pilus assembly protein PilF
MTEEQVPEISIDDAIAEIEKICKGNPDNVIAHHKLGLLYRQAGRTDEAIRELEKAIELDNQSVESYINLGAIYFDRGDVAKALELNEQALAVTPLMAEAHVNIGLIRQQEGDAKAAVACYDKAVQIDPYLLTPWLNLTSAYTMLEEDGKAVESAREAVTLEPDNGMARNNLAVALYFNGELAESRRNLDKAKELGYAADPRFEQALSEKMAD